LVLRIDARWQLFLQLGCRLAGIKMSACGSESALRRIRSRHIGGHYVSHQVTLRRLTADTDQGHSYVTDGQLSVVSGQCGQCGQW